MKLPLGKLPHAMLSDLLGAIPSHPQVIMGPRLGEDAAVIDMGAEGRCLVAKTDPITFATDAIGWYAVQINANDIATTGAVPQYFMATVLLPGGHADAALAEAIFGQMIDACAQLGVALVGGHTEITHGLERPIVVGCMFGEVARDHLITTGGARPGDVMLLSKGVPLEATAIIARERAGELAGKLDPDELARLADFIYEPGISVVQDARLALEAGGVHSMHDPTEGGLATALWEVAEAAGVGIVLEGDLPLVPEAVQLCERFGLDPMGAIASGALLLAAAPESAPAIMAAWRRAGIAAYRVGRLVEADAPAVWAASGEHLARPARDEIARLYE